MNYSTRLLLSLASLVWTSAVLNAQNAEDIKQYIGANYIGAEGMRQVSGQNSSQLLGEAGIFVGVGYTDTDVDDESERFFEGDYTVFTTSLGYVHAFDGFNFGAAITYFDADSDFEGTDTNDSDIEMDGDGWMFSAGASKRWEKLSLVVQGGFGELSMDGERANTFTSLFGVKEADFDTSIYYLSSTVLYSLYKTEQWAITPSAELGYVVTESDGFDEDGIPDQASLDDLEDDTPYIQVGAEFEYLGFDRVTPFLSLALWYDLGDDEVDLDGTDATDAPIEGEIPDAVETLFTITTGASVQLTDSLSLDGSLGYFTGDEIDGYNLSLAGVFSF